MKSKKGRVYRRAPSKKQVVEEDDSSKEVRQSLLRILETIIAGAVMGIGVAGAQSLFGPGFSAEKEEVIDR